MISEICDDSKSYRKRFFFSRAQKVAGGREQNLWRASWMRWGRGGNGPQALRERLSLGRAESQEKPVTGAPTRGRLLARVGGGLNSGVYGKRRSH